MGDHLVGVQLYLSCNGVCKDLTIVQLTEIYSSLTDNLSYHPKK